MRKILLLPAALFVTLFSFGQCPNDTIYLNSQADIDNFATNYPGCTNLTAAFALQISDQGTGSITNLDGLAQLQSLSSLIIIQHNANLQSLSGLSNLIALPGSQTRLINNPQLANLNGFLALGSNGFSLALSQNTGLTSLGGLPSINTLSFLSISESPLLVNLSGLDDINEIEIYLSIAGNSNLSSLDGLQNIAFGSSLTVQIIENDQLSSLGNLIASQSGQGNSLTIQGNDQLTSIAGLEGITNLSFLTIEENAELVNLSGLDNLEELTLLRLLNNGSITNIDALSSIISLGTFDISDNAQLLNLDGLSNFTTINPNLGSRLFSLRNNESLNDITGLSDVDLINLNETDRLELSGNLALSQCNISSICDVLGVNSPADIIIDNNGLGCNNEPEVIIACGLDINIVSGEVKFDFNLDGCDPADIVAPNLLIETTNGTTTYSTFTNAGGNYQNLIGAEGLVTSSVNPASLPTFFTATPASQDSNFIGFGNEDVIDFCLTATETINDLRIALLSTSQAVPGFDSIYDLVYENVGTTQLSGQVTLLFDENRQDFVEATPVPTNTTAGLITWDYGDLNPFESRTIKVVLNNFPPPNNEIGDELPLRAQVYPIADDAQPGDNTSEIKQIVVGAFDPNDKNVMQGSEISEAQVGTYLDYVVRFQNTGNINATTVIIEDLLDANLQWASIRPLSASHLYRAEIKNGNEVSFIFENIDLPPEMTDPEGSQGYIAFQVRTDDSLLVGDEVNNTASIFFDFNPAIVTNTVNTVVVDVQAPTAVCQSITVSLDGTGQAIITAADIDNGSSDTNGIATLELDTTTFDCSNLGENTVTLTVTDTFGNISECSAIVTVIDDLAPVLACQSVVVSLDENGLAAVDPVLLLDMTATMDNCGIESVGSSVSFVDCEAIDTPVVATVFVEDVNGNIATCQTTISAIDELPPVFDNATLPSDQTKLTDASGVYLLEDFTTGIIAEDNCSTTVTLSQTPALNEPLTPGVYDITITASDAFSNETEYTFELTVELLLGVDPFSIENKISIYPNPVSDILQIEMSRGLFLEKVTIYSIQGEKLLVTSEEKIDLSPFAEGVYFAFIETNQGAITKKIIKN